MRTRTRSVVSAVAVAATAALTLAAGPGASAAGAPGGAPDPARATTPGVYVVTLAGAPAAVRLPPRDGARFDRTRPAVTAYERILVARQEKVLAEVGDPAVLYHYTTALNGFAASLTSDQVRTLRHTPGVVLVERSTKQHVDRAHRARLAAAPGVGRSSRTLLGLGGRGGVWAQHGGPGRAGHGVVVGVVDTGIWPENPSFTGLPQQTPGTAPRLPGFHGACAAAAEWTPQDCTDKVVSARWFVNGFGEENTASAEYLSARDGTGHGSHVASTVAGDHGVRAQVDGQRFGTTSGMAPAARLAVYKACWTAPDPADDGCTTADTAAAVDQAVADGVDVLNYSLSGGQRIDDTMARTFLGAAAAGVFVAASAGNEGAAGTVQHAEPWVTTVAASTHHVFQGAVRLGDGRDLVGAMVADQPVGRARLVRGDQVAADGATPAAARRCEGGALDAAEAEGTIVVCERGGGARVDKSAAVAAAGGAGMVLLNTHPQDVDADVHAVPTVHLDVAEARTLLRYLRTAGDRSTAALDPEGHAGQPAPSIAEFSARGPVGVDVLKPDLTAPGVSVLGAVAPPSDSGRLFDLVSGTSTAAPHVAGLAALVKAVHRDWSPARIKSAMMTTAYDLHGRHGPLVEGAGQVAPADFFDPGLVFDTPPAAWRRVLTGTDRARDVNSPSVAIRRLVGRSTVVRRITNVTDRPESYSVRKHGLRAVDVQAFPATVLLGPGQTRTVRLRISARPSATVDRDVSGWLVWAGDRHEVRIPVAVRPTVVAAPTQVDGRAVRGSVVVHGRSGNGRTVKLHPSGLVPARTAPVTLGSAGTFDPGSPVADADTELRQVQVPARTDVARFEVSADEGGDDVDLYVYRDDRLVASDVAGTRTATVTLPDPEPGSYDLYAHAHDVTGASAAGELSTWLVPEDGGTHVQLSTDAVGSRAGKPFRYSASWQGLDPAKRWLGVVTYGDTDRRTLVEVN